MCMTASERDGDRSVRRDPSKAWRARKRGWGLPLGTPFAGFFSRAPGFAFRLLL
jgi:hypothetical protein